MLSEELGLQELLDDHTHIKETQSGIGHHNLRLLAKVMPTGLLFNELPLSNLTTMYAVCKGYSTTVCF